MKFLIIFVSILLIAKPTTTVSTEGPDLGIVRHDLCSGMKFSKQEIQIVEQLNCEYYCQEDQKCSDGWCEGRGEKWHCVCGGCEKDSSTSTRPE